MGPLKTVWFKLQCLFARRRKEAELAEELRTHVEMQIEANLAAGMPLEAARREAFRQLGGVEQAKELYREEWSIRWFEALRRDVRHGLRILRGAPGFTAIAIATLALGIGASTAVFSIVEAILLRPLPFQNPSELVQVEFALQRDGTTTIGCSVSELDDLGSRSGVFSEVSMVFPMSGNLTGVDEPQRVEAMAVSPNYFRLLGVAPALGRTFGTDEASVPGWAQGCVLSHEAWTNYFGGDPAVLGRKFYMDYDTFRVIGVMPPGFRHPGRTLAADVDVWFTGGLRTPPFTPEPHRSYRIIPDVLGRMKPDLMTGAAQARLDEFAARLRTEFPTDYDASERWTPRVRALQSTLVADVRGAIYLLFGAVLLVLLICCGTVANLLLVRLLVRRQEIAVRCALGASRGAIVRQLVVENLLIAGAGGIAGLTLAWALPPLLLKLAPVSVPHLNDVSVNGAVLTFALLITLATGLILGLVPALRASKVDHAPELVAGGRAAGASRTTHRWRRMLVAGQVACSMMLIAGAGLLLRSFWQAWQTNPGFQPAQVLTGRMWLPPPTDPNARQAYLSHENRVTLIRELVRRFQGLPGVQAAAIGTDLPLAGNVNTEEITVDAGGAATPSRGAALVTAVSTDYFRTLGILLRQGRVFTDSDDGKNAVAIVNATAARRYWPGQDPVGRRVARGFGPNVRWCTIVGVVGDAKAGGLDAADLPQVYLPAAQESALGLAFCVRVAGDETTLLDDVRREIHAVDADLPIYGVSTMNRMLERSLAPRRFLATIVGAFAGVSLLLAGLGVYGVIALTVTQRRREIGVRLALGATRGQVAGGVLKEGLVVVSAGIAAGALGGTAAALAIRGLLFQTHPLDPATWTSMALLLFVVALLACWLPARQAARVDPMTALRCE